jgi:hypothetical protein
MSRELRDYYGVKKIRIAPEHMVIFDLIVIWEIWYDT